MTDDGSELAGLRRGDDGSSVLFEACRASIEARRAAMPEGAPGRPAVLAHAGLHNVVVAELGALRLLLNSDGLGTKVEVAERVGRYDTLAFDLLAMLADDAARFGAEPLCVSNILDIARADGAVIDGLAQGLRAAAAAAEVAIVGGEVAELGGRIACRGPSGGLNWAGTLLSVVRRGQELTGGSISRGDAIVAVREPGLRSNGFTLARTILERAHGPEWHTASGPCGQPYGEALLAPSRIYAPAVLDLVGRATLGASARARVHGIAHITGGGVPGKLARLLCAAGHARHGAGAALGAELDALWPPGDAMAALQSLGALDDATAYRAWNMGQGLLVVTPEPGPVIDAMRARGHEAQVAGEVTRAGTLRVRSEGRATPGAWLQFPLSPHDGAPPAGARAAPRGETP